MDSIDIPPDLDDVVAAEPESLPSADALLDVKQDHDEQVPGQESEDGEADPDELVDDEYIDNGGGIDPQPTISSDIMSPSIISIDNVTNITTDINDVTSSSETLLGSSINHISPIQLDNPCPEPVYEIKRPKRNIQRLDQICCRLIADHVTDTSIIDEIPREYLPAIISMIDPTYIDIIQAARRIHCDIFWKLMSSQWPLADVKQHSGSYKRMFFEKLLQDRLESYHQWNRSGQNRIELSNELDVARPYVHSIVFREQRSHLNLGSILKGFFNLTRLDMRYGAYNLGMMYDPDELGIKGNDITGLNQLLAETKSLTMLLIRESLLNDELISVLSRGLALNQTITYLDLSHNRISDDGIQKLAQVLSMDNTVLVSLNLADNNLGPGSGISLAQALRSNTVLQSLSLRLNQIARSGAISIFKELESNTNLVQLNLSCNGIEDVGQDLISLMHANHTIQCFDLSANDAIRLEHCSALLDAVKCQSQLWELDLRLNPGLNQQIDMEIRALLNNRQERLDRARRINYLSDRSQL